MYDALGFDKESRATARRIVISPSVSNVPSEQEACLIGVDLRLRRIRRQDDFLDFDDVVVTVGFAELEGVLARDCKIVFYKWALPSAANNIACVDARREGEDDCGEPHVDRLSVEDCGERWSAWLCRCVVDSSGDNNGGRLSGFCRQRRIPR